jgi:flagellar assembly factor FliW
MGFEAFRNFYLKLINVFYIHRSRNKHTESKKLIARNPFYVQKKIVHL